MHRNSNINIMKKIVLLIGVICCTSILYAQNNDNPFADYLKINHEPSCRDVTVPYSDLFVRLMKEDKQDSVEMLIKAWKDYCPSVNVAYEADMIYDMTYQNGMDITNRITLNYVANKLSFKERIDFYKKYGKNMSDYYLDNVPNSMEYDEYVIEKAAELKEDAQPGTMKYLMSNFIANPTDSVYYEIKKDEYKGTILQKQYYEVEEYYYNKTNFIFNIGTGIWIPMGQMSSIGIKPELLTIGLGGKHKRFYFGFEAMGGPKIKYTKKESDSGNSEATFMKFAVDAIFSYDIYQQKRNEFRLLANVGLETMLAGQSQTYVTDGKQNVYYNTLMLSLGAEYGIHVTTGFSIGLRAKYNYTSFSNSVYPKGNSFNILVLFYFNQKNNIDVLHKIKSSHVDY